MESLSQIENSPVDYELYYHEHYKNVRRNISNAGRDYGQKRIALVLAAKRAEMETKPVIEHEPVVALSNAITPPNSTLLWLNEELKIPRCSAAGIVDYVCKKHGVSKLDLVSVRRTMDLILPRQEIMFKLRHHTVLTLPQIGRLLGDRDHTTVLHGIRKFQIRLDNNDSKLIPDPAHWIDGLQMHRVFLGKGDGI